MKILVINGPNMNLLGIREPDIYGTRGFAELEAFIREGAAALGVEVTLMQSNHEGDIVDAIGAAYKKYDGIVINPAAYTHTSIAIADAVAAVGIPTVEVHISDLSKREEYRQVSYLAAHCVKVIAGKGFEGYVDAMKELMNTEK